MAENVSQILVVTVGLVLRAFQVMHAGAVLVMEEHGAKTDGEDCVSMLAMDITFQIEMVLLQVIVTPT